MRKVNLIALLVGAALFTGLGATSAMAGTGDKCGGNKPAGKCGNGDKPTGKCGSDKAPGKCGGDKNTSTPPKAKGKCGAGKCG